MMGLVESATRVHNVSQPVFRHVIPPLVVGAFDLGGVLYHAKYLELLEMAREAFLTARGVSYRAMMDSGYHMVIVEAQQRFVSPIRYGQRIWVDMWASEMRRSTFVFDYKMYTQEMSATSTTPENDHNPSQHDSAQLVHVASTKLACVKMSTTTSSNKGPSGGGYEFRPARIPPFLVAEVSALLTSSS